MNGILVVDKPSGWTSHDVVAKLRGILRERRIGHGGTLDPMATGVLPIFVGRATRAAEFAENAEKRYIAGLRLGIVTDTQDTTGTTIETRPVSITEDQLQSALASFRGRILQTPPMYSAVKVGGERLYKIARRGGSVQRPPREIEIFSLELAGRDGADYILDVRCSKGTYIRTLCNDIGASLGCGGAMSSLRRTRAGVFSIDQALTLGEIESAFLEGGGDAFLRPVDSLFSGSPSFTADGDQERFIRNGRPLPVQLPVGQYRVYSGSGEFLMLGQVWDGLLTSLKNFFTN